MFKALLGLVQLNAKSASWGSVESTWAGNFPEMRWRVRAEKQPGVQLHKSPGPMFFPGEGAVGRAGIQKCVLSSEEGGLSEVELHGCATIRRTTAWGWVSLGLRMWCQVPQAGERKETEETVWAALCSRPWDWANECSWPWHLLEGLSGVTDKLESLTSSS